MWPTVEELYVDFVPNHCDQVLTAVLMCFLGFDRRVDFVAHQRLQSAVGKSDMATPSFLLKLNGQRGQLSSPPGIA